MSRYEVLHVVEHWLLLSRDKLLLWRKGVEHLSNKPIVRSTQCRIEIRVTIATWKVLAKQAGLAHHVLSNRYCSIKAIVKRLKAIGNILYLSNKPVLLAIQYRIESDSMRAIPELR